MFLALMLAVSNVAFASAPNNDSFIDHVNSKVHETIEKATDVPGLQCGAFNHLKNGVRERWDTLLTQGSFEVQGQDKEVRPYFIAIQGIVEHVLSKEFNNNVQSLVGVIHNPMPATPLCTAGEVSDELIHPEVAKDPLKAFTVKPRTAILRDYLHQGGALYVAYPEKGLSQRMEVQQKIYKKELATYSKNLFDRPCRCETIPAPLIGATYFIKDKNEKLYVFAIKMTQTNNPQELGHFGLWFGSLDNPQIQQRVNEVIKYIEQNAYEPIVIPTSHKA